MLRKTWNIASNKYLITLALLMSWLLFFDKNDIMSQVQLTRKLDQLNNEKKYYRQEVEKNKADLNELKTNPHNLEKFARENYMMKKDNEDVFVIVQEKQN